MLEVFLKQIRGLLILYDYWLVVWNILQFITIFCTVNLPAKGYADAYAARD